MTDAETTAVVIAPGAALADDLVRQAAAALDRDLYQTRRLLASKLPLVVARTEEKEAEDLVRTLAGLGLVVFSCPEAELREPLRVFRAKGLTFGEGAAVFRDEDAREFRLASADAFLVIDGIRHTPQQKMVVRKSKRLNLTAMLLTGGIPMKKTVEERTFETAVRDEHVVRLFAAGSADACVEVGRHGFDFSCLGPDMAPSSQRNIVLLAAKLREFFAGAAFDDSLAVPSPKTPAAIARRESFDADCRLIYRWRALSPGH